MGLLRLHRLRRRTAAAGRTKKLTLPALWGCIEADFLREYGIRLCSELPRMGWREFQVLLSGLSPESALRRRWQQIPREGRQAAQTFWQGVAAAGR